MSLGKSITLAPRATSHFGLTSSTGSCAYSWRREMTVMEGERTSDCYIPPVYPKRRQIDLDTPRLNCPMAFARGFDPTERHACALK